MKRGTSIFRFLWTLVVFALYLAAMGLTAFVLLAAVACPVVAVLNDDFMIEWGTYFVTVLIALGSIVPYKITWKTIYGKFRDSLKILPDTFKRQSR